MEKIIFSERCLEYSYFGHIEGRERVGEACEVLKQIGEYEFLEPGPAPEEDLLRVHSREWVERVKRSYFGQDTPGGKDIYRYAKLAVGGAILAAEEEGFSLMRPPGHHVGRNGKALGAGTLGFCYFNNIAIAVRKLDLPTLIIDIDGHHGNGTQEIFYQDPKVTYISLHRIGIYPGTGYGSGANCINIPYTYEPGDAQYLNDLEKALDQVDIERYEVIGISVGCDCYRGDLSSLGLSSKCFREIGKIIGSLERETFGVLEGGYGKHVGSCVHELLRGLEEG